MEGFSPRAWVLARSLTHTHRHTRAADLPMGTIANLTEAKLKLAMEPPKDGKQVINMA